MSNNEKQPESTMAALLREGPRRGRPRRAVSRQNVYVALTTEQKERMREMAQALPAGISRADVPDLAITALSVNMENMRRSVVGRNREIPEGITDFESLYLLWDLPLPPGGGELKWTTIRVSPQQGIELGRVHGALYALFGASRSDVFALGLALLGALVDEIPAAPGQKTMVADVQEWITDKYL